MKSLRTRRQARGLRYVALPLLMVAAAMAQSTAKRPLNHRDYDSWRSIQGQVLSRDGKFLAYTLFPQEGDGQLVVRNLATGKEVRESLGGSELLRVRVPVPSHLVGKPVSTLNVDGHILIAGVSRGGKGFIPTADSTMQEGDYLIVMMGKNYMDELDALLDAPGDHH